MTKPISKLLLCGALLCGGALTGPASAATILYTLNSSVSVGGSPNTDVDEKMQSTFIPLTGNESASVEANVKDSFGPGAGNATSGFTVDQAAGSIKFGATADITAPASQVLSRATSSMSISLAEDFTITGTGNITFRLGLEGLLSHASTRNFGGEGSAVNAFMRLVDNSSGFTTLGSDRFSQNATFNTSAVIDELLEFTVNITESKTYLFNLSMDASTAVRERGFGNSGASSADFFNTAFLSFTADPTLTVTTGDPAFLSGTTPAPVPLPAAGWLLLAGLGGLGALRRRKHTS
ncbi:VPLPA-CTERM sorting domain-containing protein [Tateyamaria armeniaca]|uniref:VPLPA-CTERM sorting domain-containing protein n=1 Tax=Tateyamaria armeniaca TaxID=2518930 RepID=A0ABW8UT94_9RHOB